METATALLVSIAALGCGLALGVSLAGKLGVNARICLVSASLGVLGWLSSVTFAILTAGHQWPLN